MLVASQRFLARAVQWALRRLPQPIDTMAATETLRNAVAALGDLPAVAGRRGGECRHRRACRRLRGARRAGASLARRTAMLETLAAAGELVQAAQAANVDLEQATRLYFRLGERLALATLRAAADKLPRTGQWPTQAALAIQDELAALQAGLLGSALGPATPPIPTPPSPPGARAASSRWSASTGCARSWRRRARSICRC